MNYLTHWFSLSLSALLKKIEDRPPLLLSIEAPGRSLKTQHNNCFNQSLHFKFMENRWLKHTITFYRIYWSKRSACAGCYFPPQVHRQCPQEILTSDTKNKDKTTFYKFLIEEKVPYPNISMKLWCILIEFSQFVPHFYVLNLKMHHFLHRKFSWNNAHP